MRPHAREETGSLATRGLAREGRSDYDATTVDRFGAGFRQVTQCLEDLSQLVPDRQAGQALAADGQLDADTLEGWVHDLRRAEGLLATVKASVVGLGDVVKVAEQAGMASTSQWLRQRFNSSSREASRQQQLADSLDQLPKARTALAAGQLGPEQATILGQAAQRGRLGAPEDIEDTLLDTASRTSPERLRERIRRAEQDAEADALRRDENRQHALRRASCVKQDDGMWRLDALLPGLEGEMVATALQAFTTPDPSDAPPQLRRRADQRLADGLISLGRAVLDNRVAPRTGGLKPHLMVLVPYDGPNPWHPELLDDARRHLDQRPVAETAGGTSLSPEATQRLLCDARISRIVMAGRSQVLDAGRTSRNWTTAQRAALLARDRGCRGPGCDRPAAWCDGHHVDWWSRGGHTDVDNGLLLCHQHHRLVHEGGWKLRVDPATGVATFTDLSGKEYTTYPPPSDRLPPSERRPDASSAGGPTAVRGQSGGRREGRMGGDDETDGAPSAGDRAGADLDAGRAEELRLPLANAPPD